MAVQPGLHPTFDWDGNLRPTSSKSGRGRGFPRMTPWGAYPCTDMTSSALSATSVDENRLSVGVPWPPALDHAGACPPGRRAGAPHADRADIPRSRHLLHLGQDGVG